MRERDSTPDEDKPIHRRAMLAAAGSVGALAAIPSVSADHEDVDYDDCPDDATHHTDCLEKDSVPDQSKERVGHGASITTPPCGDKIYDHVQCNGNKPWATGSMTAIVCHDCEESARVYLKASGGVSREPCERPSTNSVNEHVDPGEKCTLWFDGHIEDFKTGSSNMRVAFNQNACTDYGRSDDCHTC